ncbi:MAG: iron-sulfur cluster repair di-iron protein [Chitinophagaceae bacterium]|nr:iron-sulfur cluster repair di-iron protein [Chitinophagaceae bacterium]
MQLTQQTLAGIVTGNHRTASVLEKYNLDFCCKGKRTLAMACEEKGLEADTIAAELSRLGEEPATGQMPFSEMTAAQLSAYIVIHHHFYVRQILPQLHAHLEKVAVKHGDRFPRMKEVYALFTEVREEMTLHMEKEEMILFPAIRKAEGAFVSKQPAGPETRVITGAVQMMEAEHDRAGALMQYIRELTGNYQVPEGACTTFAISLAELKEFEENLHQHVHLENNLLFPMAQRYV